MCCMQRRCLIFVAILLHHNEGNDPFCEWRGAIADASFLPMIHVSRMRWSLAVTSWVVEVVLLIIGRKFSVLIRTVSVLVFRFNLFIRIFIGWIVLRYTVLATFSHN
jgi:hypothetical protein